MPRLWRFRVAGLLLLCVIGCQDAPPAENGAGTQPGDNGDETTLAQTPGQESLKPELPVLEGIDNFDGNWVLAPNLGGRNVYFWLFRLMPGDNDDWTAQTLATSEFLSQSDPKSVTIEAEKVEVDGSNIKLTARIRNPKAQIKDALLDFEGTLRDGVVGGNLFLADTGVLAPTRLLPTDAETLNDYVESSGSEGAADYQKAGSEPDPAREILKVAETRPASPATLDAYSVIFKGIVQWNLTEDELKQAIKNYQAALERWGPRLQGFAEINAGMQLAQARKHVELADELLNAGEKHLGEEKLAAGQLEAGRLNVRIARDLMTISGKDEEAAAKAYADMQELLQTQPYQPELLWAAAEYAEKQDKIDDALDYLRTIVALPLLERMAVGSRIGLLPGDATPRSSLIKLWTAKHGSDDGLKDAVFETYDQQLADLAEKIRENSDELPAADSGNRVVLMEVFTGTACEACVAADLATDMLHESLPASELVVLNYHNHVPGPDPLTSTDSEERATFYQVQGTPSVAINGAMMPNPGGYFIPEMIEGSYKQLRSAVDHFLQTSTDIVIDASAEAADGMLKVNVAVEGVPEEWLGKLRLRLALVEESVTLNAPNGIRRHSMVVRTMLGGPKGISAKQGVLKYSLTEMPLAELKARQLGYLYSYEQGKRMQFGIKPVDLKPLHLVAFVQVEQPIMPEGEKPQAEKKPGELKDEHAGDQSVRPLHMRGEILQAVQVPVTGELVYPDFEPPPGTAPDESTTEDAEKKPAKTKDETPPPDEAKPEESKKETKED